MITLPSTTPDLPSGVWPDFIAPVHIENAAPEWTDPRLPDFKLIWRVAREHGYAIGLHGSMKRDCDLIAVPWVDNASTPQELTAALCEALSARQVVEFEKKPAGRIATNLQVDGWVKLIDLSIVGTAAEVARATASLREALELIQRAYPCDPWEDDKERADYWAEMALRLREIARIALSAPVGQEQQKGTSNG